MKLSHQTLRDETLTHQVVLGTDHRAGLSITVSCNCRLVLRSTAWTYLPMGYSTNLDESRELYNNPDNHFKPFGEEDKAKW